MIVTLNPCSRKYKACLSKKGGMGVAYGVSGAGEQIGRERSEPGRKLRHIVACDIMPGRVIHRLSTTNVHCCNNTTPLIF